MTIEAVSSQGKAYQGSVPKAETPVANTEKAAYREAEPVKSDNGTEKVSAKKQNAEGKKDAADFGQEANQAKGAEKILGTEAMRKAAEEINRNAKHSEAIFGIHEGTNRVTIKIVDKNTKEVLKEYPPEKTLDIIAKVWEMAGLMVDEKG